MGHRGRSRQWAGGPESNPWQQRAGRRHGGGPFGPFGPGGPGAGAPPWMAGLFGMGGSERGRGPQVRRGDVRSAILDVLATAAREEEPINGYQVIGRIDDKSDGAWRPSPGSVYPTVQLLQDEGLVEADEEGGRRTLRLTTAGHAYVEDHVDQLAAVWTPFVRAAEEKAEQESAPDLKSEIGQMMSAVWQIASAGSEGQRRAAIEILIDSRRKLYGVLADGHDPESLPDPDGDPES